MNCILMRAGYPLAVILKNDRRKYYRALQQADTGHEASIVRLVALAVERSLSLYLRAFGTPAREHLMSLAEASRGTAYSPKYLNLLAASGRLAAQKRGRNWFTSAAAIEEYRTGRLRKR